MGRFSFSLSKVFVWLVAALVPIAWVWASISYYDALLASGTLDPDADSIGIPIGGDIAIATMVSPVVIAVTYFATRRYRGVLTPFAWVGERPVASALLSSVFAVPFLGQLVIFGMDWFRPLPWYERYWDVAVAVQLVWLAIMRAAFVGGLVAGESRRAS